MKKMRKISQSNSKTKRINSKELKVKDPLPNVVKIS